ITPRHDITLYIAYEDEYIMVIRKPSVLLMHPAVRVETDSVAAAVIAIRPKVATVGESPERPGIMHRLDKDASGVVVIAKTQDAYEDLKRQFKDRTVRKEYLVLVHGKPPLEYGTVEFPIGRSSSGNKMAARPEPKEGDKPAITHYEVIDSYRTASLLRVKTETGRTHQIRVHFMAL